MISELSNGGGGLIVRPEPGDLVDFGIIVPSSALVVPQGIGQCGTHQPIQDVRGYLQTRVPVTRWEMETQLFDRLPIKPVNLRVQVKQLQSAMLFVLRLTSGKGAIKVQPACQKVLTIYPQFRPLNTFRGKFDLWLKKQDWVCLVNRAMAGAAWQATNRGLSSEFLNYVAARMSGFKRGDAGEQAILSIHRQWATGRTHKGIAEPIKGYEANWETRQRSILPDGWNSTNIRRQLKQRDKFNRAVKALAHEGIAAARTYLPQVHGTRAGLRFMELIQFDDVRCDFRVIDIATGQICDLWLLIARDVATTMLLGFGMRPALARDDGSQEHLKLQDMKQLVGWNLETYGLPPWKMTLKMENGTATLAEAVRAALAEMLGDRVEFSMASMIGGKSATGYAEKAVGNSKSKAMLESLNRLQHMMTSHFPGQIGLNYGKRPAELVARENEAKEIWAAHRAEDRAELVYPVLTIPQAREKLFEIFRLQNQRTDHNCEGFDQIVEWHDAEHDCWSSSNPPSADCKVRARMESPMERAAKLVHPISGWTRVSPEIITSFYEHSQRRRPVENNGEINFTHEGKLLRFEPPSKEFALAPETKCLCYFNPDDPRFLTITDGRGGILGTWLRRGLVKQGDHDAVAAAIRHSTAALNVAKARAVELAADDRQQLTDMREHNAGFVMVAQPQATARKTISSPVAAHHMAVRGEKKATMKQQQRRDDTKRAARAALLSMPD